MNGRFAVAWSDTARLADQRADWQRLAAAAIEPNPFYEADFLIASMRHLRGGKPIRCAIARDRLAGDRLVGLMPLERPLIADGLLGSAWRLYASPYTCLSAPLIDRVAPADILAALLAFLASESGPKRLVLPQTVGDGPVHQLLYGAGGQHGALHVVRRHARAAIRTNLSLEEYRRRHWKKSVAANLARRSRQLSEVGAVSIRRIFGDDPAAPAALDAFLSLEKLGWKGEAGTALASRPETEAFGRAALAGAPGALYEVLSLDDRPIAVNVHLVAQEAAFAFKTAYDPDFARFGPGLLLDSAALELATRGGAFSRIDSCAGPGHPIENLWAERENVLHLAISLRPSRGRAGLPIDLALLARWLGLVERVRALRHSSSYTTRPSLGAATPSAPRSP